MRLLNRCCLSALAVLVMVTGCPKPRPDPTEPGLGGHVQRGKELQVVRNDLGQLAKLYQTYYTEYGKCPVNWDDFKAYIQRDARTIVQAVDEGRIVVVWGLSSLSGNVVLAYEPNPDLRGNHVVVMGDASVSSMTTDQLRVALQQR
jgi:hypothetical protein